MQPIILRTKGDHFEVIAVSQQKIFSLQILGSKKIACPVVELDDIRLKFHLSKIQRKSLALLEEGTEFKTCVSDNGWGSIAGLASNTGKSTSYITKRIALLNLPDDVMEAIKNSSLKPGAVEERSQ